MIRRSLSAIAAFAVLAFGIAYAANELSPKPQGAEVAFVDGVSKDLNARFATEAQAEGAGFFRYTNEDDTGAISYVNPQWWTSTDAAHPSQLWYSAGGKLLGVDYSRPYAAGAPPNLWGVNPQRWFHFNAHVHYVLDENGTMIYGRATSTAKFEAAGGNLQDPQASTIVKMGLAKTTAEVQHVFLFPSIWDLEFWVTPNPSGAFADKNPLVHPTSAASSSDM